MGTAPSTTPYRARVARADPTHELRRARHWLLIAGVLSLLAGVVAIVLPNVASVATAILIGWMLVFAGARDVVDAFSIRDHKRMLQRMLIAALCFAAGLYLLLSPLDGTFTLTAILVIWFVAVGIARLVIGVTDYPQPGASVLAVSGALSLGLGLLLAMRLPDSATWAVGLLVGVDLLFTGALLIALAQSLRRVP
jgi:uncharacterized membrane protein HdeD (DUF308 family)